MAKKLINNRTRPAFCQTGNTGQFTYLTATIRGHGNPNHLRNASSLLLIVILTGAGCMSSCREGMSDECKAFYDLSAAQRDVEFPTYPVEKQLELYMCGMRREPPDMGLGLNIADHGEKIIPFLVEKLRSEKDEYRQRNIIYIFRAMAAKGHLNGGQDIVDVIEKTISVMKIKETQQESEQILASLKREMQQ